MRAPLIPLVFVVALAAPALAEEAPPAAAGAGAEVEEVQKLLDSIQSRIDRMDEAARKADSALEFLGRQVDGSLGRMSDRQVENANLRQKALGLSKALEESAEKRREINSKLTDSIRERNDIVAALQQQVARLTDLLAGERSGAAVLRRDLESAATALREASDRHASAQDRLADTEHRLAAAERGLAAERKTLSHRQAEIDRLKRENAVLRKQRDSLERKSATLGAGATVMTAALSSERDRSAKAERRAKALNSRIVGLRKELASLTAAFDAAQKQSTEQAERIADLDRRLRIALSPRVSPLAPFRAALFVRLGSVLDAGRDLRRLPEGIAIQSDVLFAPGSARISPAGRNPIRRFARTLRDIADKIPPTLDWVLSVEAHTDRYSPTATEFPTTWELSTGRASVIVRRLADFGIPPQRLIAVGSGEFRPLDTRDDEIARRRNRRIEFRLIER